MQGKVRGILPPSEPSQHQDPAYTPPPRPPRHPLSRNPLDPRWMDALRGRLPLRDEGLWDGEKTGEWPLQCEFFLLFFFFQTFSPADSNEGLKQNVFLEEEGRR